MREILFRGKRTDNGEWVEGYLYEHKPPLRGIVPKDYIPEPNKWYITKTAFADWNMPRQVELNEVDPNTVGQYTGLLDKNGKRIFEGDVLEVNYGKVYVAAKGKVRFDCGCYMLEGVSSALSLYAYVPYSEVIGNIHDTPKLLEGGGSDA